MYAELDILIDRLDSECINAVVAAMIERMRNLI